jgi:ankyrin repeat protein
MLMLNLQFIIYILPEPDAKAILSAAEKGHLETIKKLLTDNPLLLQCSDKDGYTALHRACYGNKIEVVKVIQERPFLFPDFSINF